MAKAQGKKAAGARGKSAVKKVAARVKSAASAAKKKVAPKKSAAPKPAARKSAPAKPARPAPKKQAAKPAKPAKPVRKAAAKVKAAVKKVAARVAAKPATKAVPKPATKAVAKTAVKPAPKPVKAAPVAKAVKPAAAPAPVAPKVPAVPKPAAEEKKRGRRARPRVHSSGAPAASWLSTEKPRPASFIAAPARAEAPSAVAAPPASSDRLIRAEDLDLSQTAVRTVPVRIDVEQGAGRFYVIANPTEVTVRVGEGIEWDFRYIGGADVSAEEVVIEFEKPSPFQHTVFRTRKPGGARPHRQMSGGAVASAAGKRIEYVVRAMTPFKTELAKARVVVNVTA